MIHYVSLAIDLIFIAYFTKKLYNIENRLEEVAQFLVDEKIAENKRRNEYEVDLNSRLETIQRMKFSPLRIVSKREP